MTLATPSSLSEAAAPRADYARLHLHVQCATSWGHNPAVRPPHRSRPTAIREILPEVLASLPQGPELRTSDEEAQVRAALGKLATYCPGVRLRQGRLLITTSVPSVAHHLRSSGPDLLERLRAQGLQVGELEVEIA